MSKDLTTTGNKKVSTLMKEFNKNYPYLRLKVCPSTEKAKVKKGEAISGVDIEKTLGQLRTKKGGGEISINGRKQVGNLENEFELCFGLFVQICYTDKDGSRYYTSGSDDKKTLSALNKEKEAAGCKKGEWK
ncbi:MAG: hypothetical protein ACXITV_12370 [Luteibaculaceae bacterium]